MADSNVDRLRNAVARVEDLLSGLAVQLPIDEWASPPPQPADTPAAVSQGQGTHEVRAQVDAADRRVEAATDIERILTEAQEVAEELQAKGRRAAQAVLAEAQQVVGELQAAQRRAADAMVSQAQQVAEEL